MEALLKRAGIFILVGAFFQVPLLAQMISPKIDSPNAPFNYVAYPTDQMGIMYNSDGTEITPEGFLYTGYAEMMFFTGNPPKPINQRIRTLEKGYLPIFHYAVCKKGVRYGFQTFANSLTNDPTSNLVNFIRVTITNRSQKPRHNFFAVAFRYTSADGSHRFRRPEKPRYPGAHWHFGVPFNPNWKFTFSKNGVFRSDSLLMLFPIKENGAKYTVKKLRQLVRGKLLPTKPMGWVRYDFFLEPGDSLVLDFKMPYQPIPKGSADIARLQKLTWDGQHQRTVAFWEKWVDAGMKLHLPEAKVVNTFKTNLIYNLMSLSKYQGHFIQTVNLFQYHAFWLRDASFVVREYDLTGYHNVAKQVLSFFPRWQQKDGNFVSQGGQFDGWGQTLWAFGQHYEFTHDQAFAKKMFPLIKKAVAWLHQARLSDPYHLMPKTRPGDNERITGHVTGHNFWALLGLKKAILLAKGIGKMEDAAAFQKEYDDYYAAFMTRLQAITQMSGGYIPPGLDYLGGQDWGNLLSVYPTEVLNPFDPMVTATQIEAREKFREGIMTYGNQRYVHNYLTTNVTQTSLVRGEQRNVLHDLYSILVHTTSTNAGFEYSVVPWADRDVHHNLTPHGWFAAKYRGLVRDMMVREEGKALHLFSVISPAWLRNGVSIGVDDATTTFGNLSFSLTPKEDGAHFEWNGTFRNPPREIVVHVPYFVFLKSVTVNGKTYTVKESGGLSRNGFPKIGSDRIVLSPKMHTADFSWQRTSRPDDASYRVFVENYKREFARKYSRYLKTNSMVEY